MTGQDSHRFIQETKPAVDTKLLKWMKTNVSSVTGLPYSFYIPPSKKEIIYKNTGPGDSLTGIIERLIVEEGISIYDAALWQMCLLFFGKDENTQAASRPTEIYWRGSLGEMDTIRAGAQGQPFVYDPLVPEAVTYDLSQKGKRGFIFRIINANGRYLNPDPLNGNTHFVDFPNSPQIHWEDWKPIAGENAWVVLASLQLFHKKYFDPASRAYTYPAGAIELSLAEELARAALFLQSETGGIRMAPLGTYYHLLGIDKPGDPGVIREKLDVYAKKMEAGFLAEPRLKIGGIQYPEYHSWYYNEISTENNISWYAAFAMLHDITGKDIYKKTMERIEQYFKAVWNPRGHYFYQGMHFTRGAWQPNTQFFATDVQNWGILVMTPQKIDEWFGEGSAFRVWSATREISGHRESGQGLSGFGFTRENDRVSVEWTCGAIFAARALARYYAPSHPQWATQIEKEADFLREAMEVYRVELSDSSAAYSYSSLRGWIPFGWFSHDADVLSLASTCWIMLVDADKNPFLLP